ncbi:hypothetical protein ACQEU8_36285 [Streptomyces sp. CA-250714]|uniref:hypothetical protein n=1 Tax=Streptomyces sp. CA-250714 TaxID=3240060 RepID=UPI003D8CE82A
MTTTTAAEAAAHWIVETYDVIAVGDMVFTDMSSPARVCMTCRDEYGVMGPCVLETGALTADEINAIKTLPELHEAARTAFGNVPEWMLRDIATGAHEVPELDNRRRAFSRARRSLAYAELHRRALDTQ